MKKKIIIIGPAYPLRGGLSSFNERLCQTFLQQEHECIIYTFSLQYPNFLFPGTTQYSTEDSPKNLPIRVKINSINPFNWIKIGKEIANQKPDIVIIRYWIPFMSPCLSVIARTIKNHCSCSILSIVDNAIPHEKRLGDVTLTSFFINSCDALLTMSQKVKSDLATFNILKPIRFISHPLYDDFGKRVSKEESRKFLNIPPKENVLLFFGFIREYKGLDILLHAMALNIIRKKNIKLIIAGEFYINSKSTMDLIKKLELTPHLYMHTNFIPNEHIKYYFSACDGVVQPYRSATQSGVTPLAYYYEKPTIVTNVGSLPDLIDEEKTGFIAECNEHSIAEKILELYQYDVQYYSKYIQEKKKDLSWEKLTETVFELHQEITSR